MHVLFLHHHIHLLPQAFETDEGWRDTHPEIWCAAVLHLGKVYLSLMGNLPFPLFFLVAYAFLAEIPARASLAVELLLSLDILFPYKLFFQCFQKISLVPSSL